MPSPAGTHRRGTGVMYPLARVPTKDMGKDDVDERGAVENLKVCS